MTQLSFGAGEGYPAAGGPSIANILITVKAAPVPSASYGETVCVAGLRIDPGYTGWVRLYPINFRNLDSPQAFKKYDIVNRSESWRPDIGSLHTIKHLNAWKPRVPYIEEWAVDNTCDLAAAAQDDPRAKSLGLVRPAEILDLIVERHPGWTPDQQAKLDQYANQLDLFAPEGGTREPLEAPRFTVKYRYRCGASHCRSHTQSIIDWEAVALQRRLRHLSDAEAVADVRRKFLDEMCAPDRRPAFFIGNQAARRTTFSVLGVYWPRATDFN